MNKYEKELLTYFKLVIYDLNFCYGASPKMKRKFVIYRNKLKKGATISETTMRKVVEVNLKKEFIIK